MQGKLVTAVHMCAEPLQIESNLALAQELAFSAASAGSRVIVFPELCLCGCDLDRRTAADCCQPNDGYQTNALVPICERFNCHIVFGYVEVDRGKLYNSAAIVGPWGLEGNARKHNLSATDYQWSETGDITWPNVVTDVGRLGALVSRDCKNTFRKSYMRGALRDAMFYEPGSVDVVALLSRTASGELPNVDWIELAEAIDTNVVACNVFGGCIVTRDLEVTEQPDGDSLFVTVALGG